MPTLVQINVTANWGSTGKIAEEIGKLAIAQGWQSYIAYSRRALSSKSQLIHIGNKADMYLHSLQSRLFDNHGLCSQKATEIFVNKLEQIKPDLIHLHNIHGYYLNYPILFDWLKQWGGPVVWTLHDCWAFTGHCAHYDFMKCNKWQTQCADCLQLRNYPASYVRDRSRQNYADKKKAFMGLKNMVMVPASNWLKNELSHSFLAEYPSFTIHNGVDTKIFHPIQDRKTNIIPRIILGIASVWTERKGLGEFIKLRELLPTNEYQIILVGLSPKQIAALPTGIKGLQRTENIEQLVELYNTAHVFVNPTLEDTFPTTNLEALACGTPVITYQTGGSPEAIDKYTGVVVESQNIEALSEAVQDVCSHQTITSTACHVRAVTEFNKDKSFRKYIDLYNSILRNSPRLITQTDCII